MKMFKKAKRRIVFTILTILVTVLIGTLAMVFIASYRTVTNENYQVLSTHAEAIINNKGKIKDDGVIGGGINNPGFPEGTGRNRGKLQKHLQLNTFYTIKIANDGTAEVIENGANELYSNDELIELARSVESQKKGRLDKLLYIVSQDENGKIVCFMDNIVFSDNFNHIFIFTLIFGVIAILLITFISIKIANRIVSPMEESYKKQKQFTADAGHELKTPIAAMSANIELLAREVGDNKWLDNISYENERMRELVTELLELARNENKTVERTDADLSKLINGAILSLEAAAFENKILIEADIPDDIHALVEEKGISQLTTILLDNAISHTEVNGDTIEKIYVKLSEHKGRVVLSVANKGNEIPEEERERLFERFYRTDSSHEYTGHYGLGLAIAKTIADANNAKLSVECKEGMVVFLVIFTTK